MIDLPYNLRVITAPTAEPISTTEAKLHLRVDISDDDAYIGGLVTAARRYFEGIQGRAYVLQTLEVTRADWPSCGYFELPRAPLRSVTSVIYKDSDATNTTWSSADYIVDTDYEPGRVVLGYDESWPSATLYPTSPIRTRYKAGFVTPFTAAAATDLITATGHTYADGDAVRLSNTGGALPAGLSTLTDYYVISTSGNTFKLSLTSGGSAVDITDTGTGTHFLGVVPQTVIQGLKLLVGHWYEHREPVVVGGSGANAGGVRVATELPLSVNTLLEMDRLY